MDPSTQVVALDPRGNMVFTVVKPVIGIFQVAPEQTDSTTQGGMALQNLAENTLLQPHSQSQSPMEQSQLEMGMVQPPLQISAPVQVQQVSQNKEAPPSSSTRSRMPFAEVSSLLDPNMKGSKARKYLISYDEIKRRLQAPEKMSLRSLAAYTRVSRGPASKKNLLESLSVLGLKPSTTTSVSSSFSKLTEGDTKALCDDMKDFAHDYIDYSNMAKQLIPETNTVQHWSKIIESKNHLEDMRKCFRDPANSGAFDSVTHGLGLGILDVALDMVVTVIEQQIRILSGVAATDPADSSLPVRRRRHRNARPADSKATQKTSEGVAEQGKVIVKGKARARVKNKMSQEAGASGSTEMWSKPKPNAAENNVFTLMSVGYEAVSTGPNTEGGV